MKDFDKRRRWFTIPFRSAARIRQDVDEEFRLHIEMRTEALERTGLAPRDARIQALLEFGDSIDAARYCADMDRTSQRRRRLGDWLAELRQDTAHAIRLLVRGRAFTAATVLTLALAIGASTAVYGVLSAYLVRPLPYPESDRLVSVGPPAMDRSVREPSFEGVQWAPVDSLFDGTARWDLDGFTLPGEQGAETATGAWVSPGYFQLLHLRPALGRGFAADEYRDPAPVALISHDLWRRRFAGDSGVIGRTVTMHSADHPDAVSLVTIIGVLPRDFWPIQWRVGDVYRPFPPENGAPQMARLKPGAPRLDTERRVDAALRVQIHGAIDPAWRMTLVPMLRQHSERVRPLLTAIFGAALFMLLAACGSVAGALVSRMAARQPELAVRTALGGSRARIVRQLLTESTVLAVAAGLVGSFIAWIFLGAGGSLIEQQLGLGVPGGAAAFRPSGQIVALTLLVSAIAGAVLGIIPALSFLRFQRTAAAALLGASRSGSARSGARIRRLLVAGQVTVAMVLLFGAGLMFRTMARMNALELGFRTDGIMTGTMLLPHERYADSTAKRQGVARLLERVRASGAIRNVAAVYPIPFGGAWQMPVLAEGAGPDEESAPKTMVFTVSEDYFETMDIRLRDGRTFAPTDDDAAPRVVVVSEALARRLSETGSVIGRRIRVRVPYLPSFDDHDDRPWRTVVGVVTDTEKGFEARPTPDVYVPYAQNPRSLLSIVARSDRPEASVVEPIRRAIATVDPGLALFGMASMHEIVAERGGQRRGLTAVLGVFAAFALGLSALALYASLSYTVLLRRSELAVRIAVGADTGSILRLVVGEGLITAAIGVAAGAALGLGLGRVLENQLYGVESRDPITLVGISVVLTLVVVGACLVPAARAARTDPLVALRE